MMIGEEKIEKHGLWQGHKFIHSSIMQYISQNIHLIPT